MGKKQIQLIFPSIEILVFIMYIYTTFNFWTIIYYLYYQKKKKKKKIESTIDGRSTTVHGNV